MNEAIKLAVEKGGYNTHGWMPEESLSHDAYAITVIDPLFWQALGKARKWREKTLVELGDDYGPDVYEPMWKYMAKKWLDAHFNGPESEEKFWKELLVTKL